MAKITKNGDDLALTFSEDEIKRFGIESDADIEFLNHEGSLCFTVTKKITAAEAQKFLPEILKNINQKPWIKYHITDFDCMIWAGK